MNQKTHMQRRGMSMAWISALAVGLLAACALIGVNYRNLEAAWLYGKLASTDVRVRQEAARKMGEFQEGRRRIVEGLVDRNESVRRLCGATVFDWGGPEFHGLVRQIDASDEPTEESRAKVERMLQLLDASERHARE